MAAAVEQAARLFADLGHEVDQAQPTIDAAKWHSAFPVMMRAELVALINRRLAELGRELQPGDVEPFTEVLYRNPVTIDAYLQAQRDVVDLSWQVGAYFEHYDLWLSPTVGARVPRLGALDTSDTDAMRTWGPIISRFTSLFNLSGHPAISVPFGRDSNGLPIGIQLVAEIGYEAKLLSVAAQLEDAQPWPQIVTDRSFR